MIKIFLSHKFDDKNKTKLKLIQDLSYLDGVKIWRAEEQIVKGDSISQKITKAIKDSDYFIQIISDNESYWTNAEIELAYAEEIASQNLKIIRAVVKGDKVGGALLGQGARGVTLNFSKKYDEAFTHLKNIIGIDSLKKIIDFNLDIVTLSKPIILVTNQVNEKLINYFSKNPHELKTVDRRLFEEMIAEIFNGFGYEVELTQKTRDGGRDIIAIKNSEAELKYLIECKRPDPGNVIGIKPVRELFGVKQDERATKAILATTSYFSKDALQFFDRNKWELESRDFEGLMDWIERYKSAKNIA